MAQVGGECRRKRKQGGFWAKGIHERKVCTEGVCQIRVRGDSGAPLPLSELGTGRVCFNKINATAGKEESGLGPG